MCQAIIDLKKEAYDNGFQKGEESGFQKGEESGFQKGEESGFQKGEESGILQSSSRIAVNMYRSKYDMQEIVRMTGLTSEVIEKLVKAQPEERK